MRDADEKRRGGTVRDARGEGSEASFAYAVDVDHQQVEVPPDAVALEEADDVAYADDLLAQVDGRVLVPAVHHL